MKDFNKMTRRQLAEYIADRDIKAGRYGEEKRSLAIKMRLTGFGSDKATLVWVAEGGRI